LLHFPVSRSARKITYFEGLVEKNTSRQVVFRLYFTHLIKIGISVPLVSIGSSYSIGTRGCFPKGKVAEG
jgi:hypothetical protein